MDEYEHVTCIRNVTLKSRGTMSGLKDYIAVSTNYSFNEDVSTKGRVSHWFNAQLLCGNLKFLTLPAHNHDKFCGKIVIMAD